MYSQNEIPFLFRHGLERFIAQDTGIGDQNVYTAELLQSDLDDSITILGRANSGGSFSSG